MSVAETMKAITDCAKKLVETPKFKKGDCVKCSDGSCGIIVTCDWSDSLNCYQYYIDYIGTLDAGYQSEKDLQSHSITTMNGRDIFEGAKWKHEFNCPNGYIFKDEKGNVINATKIVLEKKKAEYPKTYEECCKILGLLNVDLCFNADYRSFDASKEQWKRLGLMNQFYQLLICRDAYWKIAGEEMGLDEPWELSIGTPIYYIYYNRTVGTIKNDYADDIQGNIILAFPTAEMRDAFKKNFDPDIEFCKELL